MLLISAVKDSLPGAFLLLVVLAVGAVELGAWCYRRRSQRSAPDDEGLLMDGVVGPSLGLFALMVAFTFGQALDLESQTYSDLVQVKLAATHLHDMAELLPEEVRSEMEPIAASYSRTLRTAITSNELDAALPELRGAELRLRRLVGSVDGPGADVVSARVDDIATAVNQLFVDSAQRVPATVFAVQTLYYIACFVMLGYQSSEKQLDKGGRLFLLGLALLFAVVMLMAMNIGRPGLNAMLFDPLPL